MIISHLHEHMPRIQRTCHCIAKTANNAPPDHRLKLFASRLWLQSGVARAEQETDICTTIDELLLHCVKQKQYAVSSNVTLGSASAALREVRI
jgi:hypothetical protein